MSVQYILALTLVPALWWIKFKFQPNIIIWYVVLVLLLCFIIIMLHAYNKLGRNAFRKLRALQYGLKKIGSGHIYTLVIDGKSILSPYPLLEMGYGPGVQDRDEFYRINIDNGAKCLLVISLEGTITIRHKTIVIVSNRDGKMAYRPISADFFIDPIEKIADALVNNNVPVQLAWSVVHPKRIDYRAVMTGQKPDLIRQLEPYTIGKILTNTDIPFKDMSPDKPSQALPKTP